MSSELDAHPSTDWESFSIGDETVRLRRVAAGLYIVGSDDEDGAALDDEKPRHWVRFTRSYGVGEHALSQGLYALVMGTKPAYFSDKADSARRPVEQVSWFDAVSFCNRLSERCGLAPAYRIDGKQVSWDFRAPGFRLPTEHEWEVAARAGSDVQFAGSDELDTVGWFASNSGWETHSVGQKAPNAWGLHDLSGNVREWCWNAMDGEVQPYSPGTVTDPMGHQAGACRVVRGGDWGRGMPDARVAHRSFRVSSARRHFLGFRLTRTLP